jgi:hypothetical protein
MEIETCFYPYIGLTHTLRRKKSKWILRISDHCRHAPAPVLEAVVMILACKVLRRKPPVKAQQTYALFRRDPLVEQAVRSRRKQKGTKRIAFEAGKYHLPQDIYRELNARYFNDQVEIGRIGWGLRRSWSRLGHFDPAHQTITLSPVLDSPRVPLFVVSYIIYHEMLHAVFENAGSPGRRRYHTREFQQAERSFPDFSRAKNFLRKFSYRRNAADFADY